VRQPASQSGGVVETAPADVSIGRIFLKFPIMGAASFGEVGMSERPDTADARPRAMKVLDRLREDHLLGVRFALNVFIASIIVWTTFRYVTDANPIWAMASMIASSEPVVKQGLIMFRSRLINTLVGCAVGLLFLAVGEPTPWKLPFALAVTVLLASYVVRIQVMWRQAPITAAIVVGGGLSVHSKIGGVESGLERVIEVIFGCVVALAVSWLMATIWPVRDTAPAPKAADPH
jgi:uncharacterized membrane protein YccC